MTDETKAAHDAALKAYKEADDALDALPDTERGVPNLDRLEKENLELDDPRAWDGRTPRWQAAYNARSRASELAGATDLSYFRLNGFGMSRCVVVMHRLGMVQLGNMAFMNWPSADGIGDDDWDAVAALESERLREWASKEIGEDPGTSPETSPVSKTISDYVDARLRVLLWVPETVNGIYEPKFAWNDGIVVTPVEIRAGLARLREHTGADVRQALTAENFPLGTWARWVEFLVYAERRGGFRVR